MTVKYPKPVHGTWDIKGSIIGSRGIGHYAIIIIILKYISPM